MTQNSRNSARWTACLALSFACLGFGLTGCQHGNITPVGEAPSTKLEHSVSVYVVTPHDGNYGETQYPGSGASVASAFESALIHYAENVVVGSTSPTSTEALEAAKAKKCTYLIFPRITHWEDRATEWSGRRDKMELVVKVIRVEDGVVVKNATISGISRFLTLGGTHPQDLLKDPVDEFVQGLF